jgi:hypothetical protein
LNHEDIVTLSVTFVKVLFALTSSLLGNFLESLGNGEE